MMTVSVSLFGLAVLCWPTGLASRRVRTTWTAQKRGVAQRCRWARRKPVAVLGAGLAAVVLWLPLGPGGGLAAALGTGVGIWRWRSRRARRERRLAQKGMAEALRALVLELRAGTHPATAAESVARDAHRHAAAVMHGIANATRLGTAMDTALAGVGSEEPALSDVSEQLKRCWRLVQRHGLPLAEMLDAAREDLEQRVRFADQVHARMAGPRSSASILAGLPVLGVLLGEAMGAAPLHVLASTPTGQVLLVIGAVLLCVGLAWTVRLTERAVGT